MDKGQNGLGVTDDDGAAYTLDTIGSQAVSVSAFMPHRTLKGDGSIDQGYAEREIVDAVHQSTGTGSNKSPLIAMAGESRAAQCAFDPLPDGPRYAACGDAVTVNVAHWIGLRLAQFDDA